MLSSEQLYNGQVAKDHEPLAWLIDRVLAEDEEQARKIWGCVDEDQTSLDLAKLHAAGCFPHKWELPLTKEGIAKANSGEAVPHAADPAGYTRRALLDVLAARPSSGGGTGQAAAPESGKQSRIVEVRASWCQLAVARVLLLRRRRASGFV